jgi:hypothetical protein
VIIGMVGPRGLEGIGSALAGLDDAFGGQPVDFRRVVAQQARANVSSITAVNVTIARGSVHG